MKKEEKWDMDNHGTASTKGALYDLLVRFPGQVSAYSMVSGYVREVAVDRWLNELQAEGLIEVIDGPKALVRGI